jgi:hypothetical protein
MLVIIFFSLLCFPLYLKFISIIHIKSHSILKKTLPLSRIGGLRLKIIIAIISYLEKLTSGSNLNNSNSHNLITYSYYNNSNYNNNSNNNSSNNNNRILTINKEVEV